MRIVLITGKGGAGKTTVAAATAVHAAASGLRTLIVSTDGAHSLGDALSFDLGTEPVEIVNNLTAHEIDAQAQLDSRWSSTHLYLLDVLEWAGSDPLRAEELAVVPGLDELLTLERLSQHTRGAWDLIVVDCSPTAETVRLLALPSTIDHYLTRTLPSHRKLVEKFIPIVRRHSSALPPVAPDNFMDSILMLAADVRALNRLLTDSAVSTVRLVTTAESMVITETQRARTYLSAFDYAVGSIVVNKLMPADSDSAFLDHIRQEQDLNMARIKAEFADLERFEIEYLPFATTGLVALGQLAREAYGDNPVVDAEIELRRAIEFRRDSLVVPLQAESDIRISRSPATIQITAGPFRRIIDLPADFRDRRTTGAAFGREGLVLEFEPR